MMIDFSMMTPEQYEQYIQRKIQRNVKSALLAAFYDYKSDKAKAAKSDTNGTNGTYKATTTPAAARHPEQAKFRDIEQRYYRMVKQTAERHRKAVKEFEKRPDAEKPICSFDVPLGLEPDELELYTEYCVALGDEMKQINVARATKQKGR